MTAGGGAGGNLRDVRFTMGILHLICAKQANLYGA
jgi:hypothetical protein